MLIKLYSLIAALTLSSYVSAVELSIGGRVSSSELFSNSVEVRVAHDWYGEDYKVSTWLRSRDGTVNPGAALLVDLPIARLQVGTHNSFYGLLASDDISFTGLAILPQGVYAQKFVNGGFSYFNGISLTTSPWKGVELSVSEGKPYILNHRVWEQSLLDSDDPWVDVLGDRYTSYRFSYYFKNKFSILYVVDQAYLTVEKQYKWTERDLYKSYPNVGSAPLALEPKYLMTIRRLGVSYAPTPALEMIAEYAELTVTNARFQVPGSNNYYAAIYYSLSPIYEVTFVKSFGNPEGKKANTDYAIGVNVNKAPLLFAIEYHVTQGHSWGKGNSILLGWSFEI